MKAKPQIIAVSLILLLLVAALFYWLRPIHRSVERYKNLESFSDADLNTLIEVHKDCFEETKRKNLIAFLIKYHTATKRSAKKQVEQLIEKQNASEKEFFRSMVNVGVMRENGTIIGLYNCETEEAVTKGSMMIYNVCLRSDRRGQGLGDKLMDDAFAMCLRPGRALTLTVYQYDTKVLDFYRRLNFKITDNLDGWDDDFNYFNKVLMEYQKAEK